MQQLDVWETIGGGVTAAAGFMAAGVVAGLRASGRKDICLIVSSEPAAAAGVFTRNTMAAAPVIVSREHVATGRLRAIVANAGNANACTGERGLRDAQSMARETATALGCKPVEVAVASTGVIGVHLPIEMVTRGIAEAVGELDSNAGSDAAEAVMTTDTFPKETAVAFTVGGERCAMGGLAKGAGMIRPDMATMLSFVTTDAALSPAAADAALRSAVAMTFNRISIDGDTSTNDMVLFLANGAAGGDIIDVGDPDLDVVTAALTHVCGELARMIVRDGEGATKLVTVTVRGAVSMSDAEKAAFAIAESPLVKTALYGQDANWGRVAMAIGKSGAAVDASTVEIAFAGITTCVNGMAVAFDEVEASAALAEDEVEVLVDLHAGDGEATVWTCDLTHDYIRINADYRS